VFSLLWAILSIYLATPWIADLSQYIGSFFSYFIIYGIAIIPGFMNAFLVSSLFMDNRPYRKFHHHDILPPITILIAAYNEEDGIISTLESIQKQNYPGKVTIIIVDDGSTDRTYEIASSYKDVTVIRQTPNAGKASALNLGLQQIKTDLVVTIDGDCYLYKNALYNLVTRYLSDPQNTVAVAGAILVRNSRENFITKIQEWDYFLGIAAVKRLQSMYQGTLVAQGAFSLFETRVLREVGGWKHVVGEDVVLTWELLGNDYRVGFAEDAIVFTNVPTTAKQFFSQRLRWSRGMIEAFKQHPSLLFKRRLTTLFIWWNIMFPYLDINYVLVFVPGLLLALFGYYWIAGPMTLILLPLMLFINYKMFSAQMQMFKCQGLKVRKNFIGFVAYSLFYGIILQPACVVGYFKELLFGHKKNWGTK
jgi:poly-beta-1,6-N-acetyl-D-glucosamine synthase